MGTGFYGGRFSPSGRCVCMLGVRGGEEERGCRPRGQAPATWEPPRLAIHPRWTMHREKGVIQFCNALAVRIPPRHRDRYFPCYRMFRKKSHR